MSALTEAQATCEGIHRLIQKISVAAVDMDKGGSSSYEMLALIASATTCITNLSTQLSILETIADDESNVYPIKIKKDSPADDDSCLDERKLAR